MRELKNTGTGNAEGLGLRALAEAKPDPMAFPDFDGALVAAFEEETRLFVGSLLRENAALGTLLSVPGAFKRSLSEKSAIRLLLSLRGAEKSVLGAEKPSKDRKNVSADRKKAARGHIKASARGKNRAPRVLNRSRPEKSAREAF